MNTGILRSERMDSMKMVADFLAKPFSAAAIELANERGGMYAMSNIQAKPETAVGFTAKRSVENEARFQDTCHIQRENV